MGEWLPVTDYPRYEVSYYGLVRRVDSGVILEGYYRKGKYELVNLTNENGLKTFYTRTLVCNEWFDGDRKAMGRHLLPPPPKRKKVMIVDTGQIFDSAADCARFIGGERTNIYATLKGRHATCLGYTLRYVD